MPPYQQATAGQSEQRVESVPACPCVEASLESSGHSFFLFLHPGSPPSRTQETSLSLPVLLVLLDHRSDPASVGVLAPRTPSGRLWPPRRVLVGQENPSERKHQHTLEEPLEGLQGFVKNMFESGKCKSMYLVFQVCFFVCSLRRPAAQR